MNYVSKYIKKTIGISLIGLGFASFGFSIYVYLAPLKEQDSSDIRKKAIAECTALIKSSGYVPAKKGDNLNIVIEGLSDWRNDIAETSFIALQCEGFSISEYCMGTECKDERNNELEGTYMQLRYSQD